MPFFVCFFHNKYFNLYPLTWQFLSLNMNRTVYVRRDYCSLHHWLRFCFFFFKKNIYGDQKKKKIILNISLFSFSHTVLQSMFYRWKRIVVPPFSKTFKHKYCSATFCNRTLDIFSNFCCVDVCVLTLYKLWLVSFNLHVYAVEFLLIFLSDS